MNNWDIKKNRFKKETDILKTIYFKPHACTVSFSKPVSQMLWLLFKRLYDDKYYLNLYEYQISYYFHTSKKYLGYRPLGIWKQSALIMFGSEHNYSKITCLINHRFGIIKFAIRRLPMFHVPEQYPHRVNITLFCWRLSTPQLWSCIINSTLKWIKGK